MEDIRSDIDDLRFGVIRKVLMLRIWETEVDEIRLEQVDLNESWQHVALHRKLHGKNSVLKSSSNKPFPSHQLFLAPPQLSTISNITFNANFLQRASVAIIPLQGSMSHHRSRRFPKKQGTSEFSTILWCLLGC
jgi:hypothetical protein